MGKQQQPGSELLPKPQAGLAPERGAVDGEAYLVVILAGHDVGEGDLRLEHLAAVHELHEQVAHGLELHPLGWFYV